MSNEKKTTASAPKKEFEATYTIAELLGVDFGTSSVIVRAALKKGGKESYTMNEAKTLINTMKNKEVKA